ncbi:hypothetical protein WJX81_000324 [Elliptochloris bilobata]|uniref:AMP-dependent synthetase/ligase domain-containing protein n=1 Tax=Elliptochloris bilobata TaxID=381761 RepID=A0AAW1QL28_9CHLO
MTALAGCTCERPLFVCGDTRRSAGEVASRVGALAAALRINAGTLPGDRVVLITRGSAAAFEALLAVLAAGAVAAPLNVRWSAGEAAAAADLVGAAAVVFDTASSRLALPLLSGNARRTGVCLDDVGASSGSGGKGGGGGGSGAAAPMPAAFSSEALVLRHAGARLEPVLAPEGAAVVCFTSGTTGAAKGALLTHGAFHCQAVAKLLEVGYSGRDVYLHCAPLFHIGGLSSALAVLAAGAVQVFMPMFSAPAALALIARHRVTALIAVPAMLVDLLGAHHDGRPARAHQELLRRLAGAPAQSRM